VVQRAFFPEGPEVPHVYVLHPPGGIVGGDRLHLAVEVRPGAHALLTTPAATKIYRTAGPRSLQRQTLTVEAGATLEWLPAENILHDGSAVDLHTEVRLGAGARFIGTEMLCFGVPAGRTGANGAGAHGQGRCRQRFELWRDGRPLLLERGRFDATDAVHAAPWGLGGAPVVAMLVATPAPADAGLWQLLRAESGSTGTASGSVTATTATATGTERPTTPERMGVTRLGDTDTLVARYVGHSPERARAFLHRVWTHLRPAMLARPAVAPRIWAT
jgi:urease accessory protein